MGSLATVSIIFAIVGAAGIFGIGVLFHEIQLYIPNSFYFSLMSLGIGVLTPATTTILMELLVKNYLELLVQL